MGSAVGRDTLDCDDVTDMMSRLPSRGVQCNAIECPIFVLHRLTRICARVEVQNLVQALEHSLAAHFVVVYLLDAVLLQSFVKRDTSRGTPWTSRANAQKPPCNMPLDLSKVYMHARAGVQGLAA